MLILRLGICRFIIDINLFPCKFCFYWFRFFYVWICRFPFPRPLCFFIYAFFFIQNFKWKFRMYEQANSHLSTKTCKAIAFEQLRKKASHITSTWKLFRVQICCKVKWVYLFNVSDRGNLLDMPAIQINWQYFDDHFFFVSCLFLVLFSLSIAHTLAWIWFHFLLVEEECFHFGAFDLWIGILLPMGIDNMHATLQPH